MKYAARVAGLLIGAFFVGASWAGGEPTHGTFSALGASEVWNLGTPAVEAAREAASPLAPSQVGFSVGIDSVTPSGVEGWEAVRDGRSRWSASIGANGAQALRLRIDHLVLPAGWVLSVQDTSGVVLNRYEGKNGDTELGTVWSAPVAGSQVLVSLDGPQERTPTLDFAISEISYFYAGFDDDSRGLLLPCQTDVRCASGVDLTARGSIGRVTYHSGVGEYMASCVLIEDSILEDRQGYILTSAAVGDPAIYHSVTTVHWRYFTAGCGSQPPNINSLPQSHGASPLARSVEQDYTLLQLWEPVPVSPGPSSAPWTLQPPSGTLRALHHPTGSVLRYATGDIEAPAGSCPEYPDADYLFHDFASGTYQPGSDGGGVFDSDWNLVGILSGVCSDGVEADCDNHEQVSVVSSRFAAILPDLEFWLNNESFVDDMYEPNNTQNEAAPLVEGTYDLTLLHDVYDWFSFTPSCSGILTFTMEFAEVHMGPSMKITDEAGFTIFPDTNIDQNHPSISMPVAANRTYNLRVFLRDGDGGPYRLTVALDETDLARTVAATLPPLPGLPENQFVWSSAMYDNELFVGVAWSELAGTRAGAVFVYDRVADGSWCLAQTILPELGNDGGEFGHAVAVSDAGVLLIGAPHGSGLPEPGKAFVYERVGRLWQRVQTLAPSNGRIGDSFGRALAVDGQYAIIGAPSDNLHGTSAGAAYIYGTFGSPDGSWIQQSRIEPIGMGETPGLGAAVAISGTTAFSTIPGSNAGDSGVLVVMKRRPTFLWSVDQVLEAAPGVRGLRSIVLANEQVWLGDSSVHVFARFEGLWYYIDQLIPPEFAGRTGLAMARSGEVVAVSQPDSAVVYQYRQVEFAVPELIAEIRPEDPFVEGMGWSLATDGDALVIDGHYTTQWDDDCNGDGFPDHCQIASGELADTNNNGIADECEQNPCIADLVEPMGVLDFFDLAKFLDYFSKGDPRADLAQPYCSLDFFDLLAYLNAFAAGCQ